MNLFLLINKNFIPPSKSKAECRILHSIIVNQEILQNTRVLQKVHIKMEFKDKSVWAQNVLKSMQFSGNAHSQFLEDPKQKSSVVTDIVLTTY